ncbi:MAG: HIT domain-containing protein [Deltaproteobacteria bacterium]|nr:HIT domain-containing protein [Deltaproteobacteria bacterium]NIS78534.1 HIT domain-containing protein [Deltaproteobacteria bacterium]
MVDCIFCKIIEKDIPATVVWEDDAVIAFNDINPVAPVHVLIVPKKHMVNLNDVQESDGDLLGRMLLVASRIAREKGIHEKGYRTVINNGGEGGQIVMHLHMHLIGGKQLGHKMG